MKIKYLVFYAVSSSSNGMTTHASGFFDLGLKIETEEHLIMLRDHVKKHVNMKGIYVSITGLYDVTPKPAKPEKPIKRGYTRPTKLL